MTKLCECGCSEQTRTASRTNAKFGHIKGQPIRFINGHNRRGAKVTFTDEQRRAISANRRGIVGKGMIGPDHPRWAAEPSYSAVHQWVSNSKAKTGVCSRCGNNVGTKTTAGTHWANVDHTYRRELEDYVELCAACHAAHDKEHGLR